MVGIIERWPYWCYQQLHLFETVDVQQAITNNIVFAFFFSFFLFFHDAK